jgi:hypothetical protein
MPVSDGAAPSVGICNCSTVVIFGWLITMPDAVMAREPIASIAGREPMDVSITVKHTALA